MFVSEDSLFVGPIVASTMTWLLLAAIVLATGTFMVLRLQREQLYARLTNSDHAGTAPDWGLEHRSAPSFAERLCTIDGILEPGAFQRLTTEIEGLNQTERSYLPSHKKGGTIAYETLCARAPSVVALYRSQELARLVSQIVGEPVQPTPLNDQSSCSVLSYEKPGDHISWHYDHNFYRGRHFTVLIPIVNRGATPDALSAARLLIKAGPGERAIQTPPNTLVVFEGARVLHKVTPIAAGERRVVLSMTFATDPTSTLLQGFARRWKDTAFFGIRALWT
jgi:2OG-Fe(II) oxygenase superfamily